VPQLGQNVWPVTGSPPLSSTWSQNAPYFRPETMALIDAVIDHKEVSPGLLMAS
jgi:hypothetical protein